MAPRAIIARTIVSELVFVVSESGLSIHTCLFIILSGGTIFLIAAGLGEGSKVHIENLKG